MIDKEKIPDVPEQYRKQIQEATLKLIDIGDKIFPIISELGDAFDCFGENVMITIKRKPIIEQIPEDLKYRSIE